MKYHWKAQQGIDSLTQAQSNEIQATDLGHASKDIFEAIERGDFPRWELYLQLPINQPIERPATNQRDGQLAYSVDTVGQNPHVNYEPTSLGGLEEDPGSGPEHQPYVEGRVGRQHISRRNDHAQAGERYRTMPDWEREDFVFNIIDLLGQCDRPIQERMVDHLSQCHTDYGRRVAEGPGLRLDLDRRVGGQAR